MDDAGRFTKEAGNDLEGLHVLTEGTKAVLEKLQSIGALIHEEEYKHKYPYDWRSKKPIIVRATKQWFADVSQLRDKILETLQTLKTVPDAGLHRLQSFTLNRKEWCISRQRSWGVPIPFFIDRNTGEYLTDENVQRHVRSLVGKLGTDCWWTLPMEELLPEQYRHDAQRYERSTDTLDVWFDSGCSWTLLPSDADVYLEGSDQHRGWFQSSLLTSRMLHVCNCSFKKL